MTIYLTQLSPISVDFPNVETAVDDPDGLLAFGGDLKPERLVSAYRHGIFPWFSEQDPLLWWSPSVRALINPTSFKPSKSLRKFIRKTNYKVTVNQQARDVIRLCAETRSADQTWITEEMQEAYYQLHQQGHCHSIEVWSDDQLVGGLYGILVGELFCGESMFSLKDNSSKVALWALAVQLLKHGGKMIDCQMITPHLTSLGAEAVQREPFITQLQQWRENPIDSHCFQPQQITIKSLLEFSTN
ncbi:leucyl/phenylalanyl-tRNA--protein transferase [Vibrio sp. SS-MA-C1-2]|uniref:leucyl/phenylalanyl-tRNA--protein transferase n=1 Tax=Vibrio sp. SS-MA-C1-2 TaxID=2908646 RepID=UPI001F29653C|nr:leucyl/phenylalanyl-tRNA--protein transferase [Vibrio sp. SS-MA-C1-2]UJF19885.1 leucyl/phenylalanyl-tRNA--protein transferase [Vibrio sp. SS-MA-C1-2]